ncbi:CynX/NimT family MFS transporter [Oceaniglobus roseus]|uniref:MFS transporter n=1 Tax=Oceaniglobus roseus TaxID=1737570 RepID=UPI000C7F4EDD|nr:MFS transporter [Kandeliimicrobium roseum]
MVSASETLPRATGRIRWTLLLGVWLIYFCFGLTSAVMAPMVGLIRSDLDAGNAAMGAVLGAWQLAYIFAAIPCGILLDRLGVRWMLVASCAVMALSATARALSDTPLQLWLAVAFFGLGGPMISIGAPKLITGLFRGAQRGGAMGVYMTGPFLGGIAGLALTHTVLLPAFGDWRGVLLAVAAFVALAGLCWAVLTALPGFAEASHQEGQGKKFDLSAFGALLRYPEVQLILVMSIGIFFINHGMNNWLPELLVAGGLSPTDAGYWAACSTAVCILGAVAVPRLATPERRIGAMAGLFAAALAASLLLQFPPGPPVALALVLQGIARGSMMTVAIMLLMESKGVPADRLGLAGGLFFTMAEIGGVLGPVTFGVLSAATGGFAAPLAAMSLVCVVLMGVLWRLRGA